MQRKTSLITAYILDGKKSGTKIGWDEINNWSPDKGTLWVHLNYTATKAQTWLKKSSGLDRFSVRAMLTTETRPRSIINPNGLLVILRGVNLNPGQDPEDMISVRIWLDENRIITAGRQALLSIKDVEDTINNTHGPNTNSELLVMLNDRLNDRIGDVIDTLDSSVDDLEQAVLTDESYALRPKIADLRREAILIRRYLAPQRDAVNRLQMEDNKWLTIDDRIHLREANDRVIRYIEDLDSARERAAVSQEELSSKLSEQIDSRMYLLSLIAAVFLPLSFITGLLGINVEGIPGAKYHSAFMVVCFILIVIFFGLYLTFKRKKWI